MEHRRFGKSGLQVGVIGMGTWRTFDISPSDNRQMAIRTEIVEEAIESGVNFFDSSPMYGNAELVLARALGSRRSEAIVATKVWSQSFEEGTRQIERALQYYGGRVEVYQVHNLVGWREYLPILRNLKSRELVRAVGVTHYAHSAFGEMRRIIEMEGIDAIQIPYNAAADRAGRDILPAAVEHDVGVIVMSPFGTGQLLDVSPPAAELKVLEEFGVRTWAQALLKWVVSDARVHTTIPATSRPGRMRENAAAGDPPFFGPDERDRVARLVARAVTR